jgi:hypothetical protein
MRQRVSTSHKRTLILHVHLNNLLANSILTNTGVFVLAVHFPGAHTRVPANPPPGAPNARRRSRPHPFALHRRLRRPEHAAPRRMLSQRIERAHRRQACGPTSLTLAPLSPHRPQTINNLVEKSPQTWHTTVGLPFRRIEGTVRRRPPCRARRPSTCAPRRLTLTRARSVWFAGR